MKIHYKNFEAIVQFSLDLHLYVAEIFHFDDLITFSAVNLHELQGLMQDAVEHYLSHTKASFPLTLAVTA